MALPSEFPRHRFDSADVVRLVEAGILRETDRVELIEGELIVTPPQGPEHASIANELDDLLRKAYSDDFRVRASLPLTLGEQTDPEPDVAVVLGAVAAFRQRHPRGDEAVLVIEVAQTSHALDREKIARYARGGVPVYWIVDVPARTIEVYSEPVAAEQRYRTKQELRGDDAITLPRVEQTWRVRDLLP